MKKSEVKKGGARKTEAEKVGVRRPVVKKTDLKKVGVSRRKKILIAVATPVFLALVVVLGFVLHYLGIVDRFLEQARPDFDEYVEYNLVAPKDKSGAVEAGERVGYVGADLYAETLAGAIRDELGGEGGEISDPTSLAAEMMAGELRLALVSDDHLNLYGENYVEFYDYIVVIERVRIPATHGDGAGGETMADITKPFAVYISGIDTREGNFPFASRSDVNIIMVINPETHSVLTVSTPRDFYVQLHGTTGVKDKLTHAGVYGVEMSMRTLEDFYGIGIPYYVRVNFNSLVRVVDTIGGITVNSDREFKAYNGQVFQKGVNNLDGAAALAYSRERKAFAEGDRMRGVHQQQVIEAIVQKALSPDLISRFEETLDSLTGTFQTNVPSEQIKALAWGQLNSLSSWSFAAMQVNGRGDSQPTYSMGALRLYVMQPDMGTVERARGALYEALGE